MSPDKGALEFYEEADGEGRRLAATSYFDALMRIEGAPQAYLTDGNRMKRFYNALQGRVTSPGYGAAGVPFEYGSDAALPRGCGWMPNGLPHVPGGAWTCGRSCSPIIPMENTMAS